MPQTDEEKRYTAWQEAAGKDIELAFGVLQCRFQMMARPFLGHCLEKISRVVSSCLIMHNMCVSDRVMDGDVCAKYNSANKVMEEEDGDMVIDYKNGEENLVLATLTIQLLSRTFWHDKIIGLKSMIERNTHVPI
jgi:hypothetical protein